MEKPGRKVRDIKFYSEKNKAMQVVHNAEARTYAKYLEAQEDVAAYEVGKPLDEGRLQSIPRIDIRGDYFNQPWASDFYLRHRDGTVGVREIIRTADLDKRAEVEKLELSRRYWAALGVADWKAVAIG